MVLRRSSTAEDAEKELTKTELAGCFGGLGGLTPPSVGAGRVLPSWVISGGIG